MSVATVIRYCFVGVVAGVVVASFFVWPGMLWILGALAASVFAVWSRSALGWCVIASLLGMMLGVWRTEAVSERWQAATESFVPGDVSGEARIAGEWSPSGSRYTVPIVWEACDGRLCPSERSLLNVSNQEDWLPGEYITVSCRVELAKNLSQDFDYRMYLAKDGIGSICTASQADRMLGRETMMTGIFRMRDRLERALNAAIPEPENGLLEGVIFGGSGRLPKDIQQDFARTGLSHIVAVSGYNVLIVAECLLWLGIFFGLWRRQAFWVALMGIWLFVLGTGAGASVVRAGIMGTLGFVAIQIGRLSSALWLVVFAAAGMLLWNPLSLRFDLGFQLSFLATGVLVAILPLFQTDDDAGFLGTVREIGVATLVIEIIVAPLLLRTFGFTSLVSLPANILVLPLVPMAMLLTFLAALAGLVIRAPINVFGWLAYALGRYMLAVVSTLSHLSWATLEWEITLGEIVVWYAVVGFGLYFFWQRKIRKERATAAVH